MGDKTNRKKSTFQEMRHWEIHAPAKMFVSDQITYNIFRNKL